MSQQEDPIYSIPPMEQVPEVMMLAAQLADVRDWGHTPLKLEQVHQYSEGDGIVVAVLDTGMDLTHPDLKDVIIASRDFTGSPSGPSDVQGHGSHCAGIVAASSNGNGIIGAAPRAKLINGKVLGDNGSGASSGIAAGVRWAVQQGANIISMSLGSAQASSVIQDAIKDAVAAGVIVVAAAGNDGPNEGTIGYPGRFPECICVAAVDKNLVVANFSSRGSQLDVSAPGVGIYSCYPGGRYASLSGTSMATPYVSGCIAAYLGYLKKKGLRFPTPAEMMELVKKTSVDLDVPGLDTRTGYGLANPLKLIQDVPTGPVDPSPGSSVVITSPELAAKGISKITIEFS